MVRQPRGKIDGKAKVPPVPVGPFGVLDVSRQTGKVLVSAPPYTSLRFKHGPDYRRAEAKRALDSVRRERNDEGP